MGHQILSKQELKYQDTSEQGTSNILALHNKDHIQLNEVINQPDQWIALKKKKKNKSYRLHK
jgi:hypothetical protein